MKHPPMEEQAHTNGDAGFAGGFVVTGGVLQGGEVVGGFGGVPWRDDLMFLELTVVGQERRRREGSGYKRGATEPPEKAASGVYLEDMGVSVAGVVDAKVKDGGLMRFIGAFYRGVETRAVTQPVNEVHEQGGEEAAQGADEDVEKQAGNHRHFPVLAEVV